MQTVKPAAVKRRGRPDSNSNLPLPAGGGCKFEEWLAGGDPENDSLLFVSEHAVLANLFTGSCCCESLPPRPAPLVWKEGRLAATHETRKCRPLGVPIPHFRVERSGRDGNTQNTNPIG